MARKARQRISYGMSRTGTRSSTARATDHSYYQSFLSPMQLEDIDWESTGWP